MRELITPVQFRETMSRAADPLGEALHLLRMNGMFYSRSEVTAPWGVELPPFSGFLLFHVVISGRCWLEIEGSKPQLLQTGDFALVPHGDGHKVVSEVGNPTFNMFDVPRQRISERYELLSYEGGGEPTNMICVAVCFEHPAAHQLIQLLPRFIYIEARRSAHFEWIQSTLGLIASEAEALRPGGETVITRLADVLVIQAIRSWIEADPAAQSGWLGALQDEQIGHAVLAIQREPDRAWSVAELAKEVAMSRSAFSARFKELVEESPMQYVTRWRMNVALTLLREGDLSLWELAERLGYQSEAAFSRAFKRTIGISPGVARRNNKYSVS
ncbi:MAG: AraC family transcriptional regulator [Chloroflexota bacterium]